MASKKKKAAKAGSGAIAAGQAARNNEYVQRLIDDDSLRDDLRTAFESARKAYDRINGKGPQKALDDKKTQKELKEAATSLKSAADSLRGGRKKKRGGKGKFLLDRHRRCRPGARPQRGPAQQGARRAVRRRGGVRVHVVHDVELRSASSSTEKVGA